MMKKGWLLIISIISFTNIFSQERELKINLDDEGNTYFRFSLLSQAWLRHTELNPGSTIGGFEKTSINDIGIRRARMQAYGKVADRVFLYSQFGMNNFNFQSPRKQGFFIHDMMGEFEMIRTKLSMGLGLTGWNGLTRFASPSAGTIMGLDAPLFEQNTNDVTDQFLRKLSLYAKGKLGGFDYRLVMSHPMLTQGISNFPGSYSNFSTAPPKMQWQGYFQYQFFDQESNLTPYNTGTYLGTKKVFNIGAGFQYQPDAMWHGNISDTNYTALKNFALDIYYDAPLQTDGSALHFYGAYVNSGFGPGYIRNLGVMNPAPQNAPANDPETGGNGFPAFGTGDVVYVQAGIKTKNNLLGKTSLMPYASMQWSNYDRLKDKMIFWDAGINWLIKNHSAKISIAYQNRPVYENVPGEYQAMQNGRKGSLVMQMQVMVN